MLLGRSHCLSGGIMPSSWRVRVPLVPSEGLPLLGCAGKVGAEAFSPMYFALSVPVFKGTFFRYNKSRKKR